MEKIGQVVIVPWRAVCSPVIEPLGFFPHHLLAPITHWFIALRFAIEDPYFCILLSIYPSNLFILNEETFCVECSLCVKKVVRKVLGGIG